MPSNKLFKEKVSSQTTAIVPLIHIDNDIFISTKTLKVFGNSYESSMTSLPALSQSINIRENKFKINTLKLKIVNNLGNGKRFSDVYNIPEKINTTIEIYFYSEGLKSLSECYKAYKGKIFEIEQTDKDIFISCEDNLTLSMGNDILSDRADSLQSTYMNKEFNLDVKNNPLLPISFGKDYYAKLTKFYEKFTADSESNYDDKYIKVFMFKCDSDENIKLATKTFREENISPPDIPNTDVIPWADIQYSLFVKEDLIFHKVSPVFNDSDIDYQPDIGQSSGQSVLLGDDGGQEAEFKNLILWQGSSQNQFINNNIEVDENGDVDWQEYYGEEDNQTRIHPIFSNRIQCTAIRKPDKVDIRKPTAWQDQWDIPDFIANTNGNQTLEESMVDDDPFTGLFLFNPEGVHTQGNTETALLNENDFSSSNYDIKWMKWATAQSSAMTQAFTETNVTNPAQGWRNIPKNPVFNFNSMGSYDCKTGIRFMFLLGIGKSSGSSQSDAQYIRHRWLLDSSDLKSNVLAEGDNQDADAHNQGSFRSDAIGSWSHHNNYHRDDKVQGMFGASGSRYHDGTDYVYDNDSMTGYSDILTDNPRVPEWLIEQWDTLDAFNSIGTLTQINGSHNMHTYPALCFGWYNAFMLVQNYLIDNASRRNFYGWLERGREVEAFKQDFDGISSPLSHIHHILAKKLPTVSFSSTSNIISVLDALIEWGLIDQDGNGGYDYQIIKQTTIKKYIEGLSSSSCFIPFLDSSINKLSFISVLPVYDVLNTEKPSNKINVNDILNYSAKQYPSLDKIINKVRVEYAVDEDGDALKFYPSASSFIEASSITTNLPDGTVAQYKQDFYSSEGMEHVIKTPYIQNEETAKNLANYYLRQNANQRLHLSISLSLKYIDYNVGSIVWFSDNIQNKAIMGFDLNDNKTIVNGQQIFKYFVIIKKRISLNKIDFEMIQLASGTDNFVEDNVHKGCMNVNALNYDSSANFQDQCVYAFGCLDENAENYLQTNQYQTIQNLIDQGLINITGTQDGTPALLANNDEHCIYPELEYDTGQGSYTVSVDTNASDFGQATQTYFFASGIGDVIPANVLPYVNIDFFSSVKLDDLINNNISNSFDYKIEPVVVVEDEINSAPDVTAVSESVFTFYKTDESDPNQIVPIVDENLFTTNDSESESYPFTITKNSDGTNINIKVNPFVYAVNGEAPSGFSSITNEQLIAMFSLNDESSNQAFQDWVSLNPYFINQFTAEQNEFYISFSVTSTTTLVIEGVEEPQEFVNTDFFTIRVTKQNLQQSLTGDVTGTGAPINNDDLDCLQELVNAIESGSSLSSFVCSSTNEPPNWGNCFIDNNTTIDTNDVVELQEYLSGQVLEEMCGDCVVNACSILSSFTVKMTTRPNHCVDLNNTPENPTKIGFKSDRSLDSQFGNLASLYSGSSIPTGADLELSIHWRNDGDAMNTQKDQDVFLLITNVTPHEQIYRFSNEIMEGLEPPFGTEWFGSPANYPNGFGHTLATLMERGEWGFQVPEYLSSSSARATFKKYMNNNFSRWWNINVEAISSEVSSSSQIVNTPYLHVGDGGGHNWFEVSSNSLNNEVFNYSYVPFELIHIKNINGNALTTGSAKITISVAGNQYNSFNDIVAPENNRRTIRISAMNRRQVAQQFGFDPVTHNSYLSDGQGNDLWNFPSNDFSNNNFGFTQSSVENTYIGTNIEISQSYSLNYTPVTPLGRKKLEDRAIDKFTDDTGDGSGGSAQ